MAATAAGHSMHGFGRGETVPVEIEGDAGADIRAALTASGFAEDRAFAAAGARRNVLFRKEAR